MTFEKEIDLKLRFEQVCLTNCYSAQLFSIRLKWELKYYSFRLESIEHLTSVHSDHGERL